MKLSDSNIIKSRFVHVLPIIYRLSSICVEAQQNAWPGNRIVKCADAYIFRRKCYGESSISTNVFRNLICFSRLFFQNFERLQNTVWDAATCSGTLNNQHDEPTSFFFFSLSPFLFFSSRMSCLVVSLPAWSCACKCVSIIFVYVDLCWSATKCMTGKSLCEMRGRV